MEVCKKNTTTAIEIQKSFHGNDMAAMISLCITVQQAQEAERIAMTQLDDVVAQLALLTEEATLTNGDAAQALDPNAITRLRPDAGK